MKRNECGRTQPLFLIINNNYDIQNTIINNYDIQNTIPNNEIIPNLNKLKIFASTNYWHILNKMKIKYTKISVRKKVQKFADGKILAPIKILAPGEN
jgi:hypothetical protein